MKGHYQFLKVGRKHLYTVFTQTENLPILAETPAIAKEIAEERSYRVIKVERTSVLSSFAGKTVYASVN